MIKNYEAYLNIVNKKLAGFFERSKDYVFCKEGCSFCCSDGEYPYTQLEFTYLMLGLSQLDAQTQTLILSRAGEVLRQKAAFTGETFTHECPFLLNNRCSVYSHRGIICRTHGLAYYIEGSDRTKVPNCVHRGLNYSNVYDKETKKLSSEMFEATGFADEPVAFNLSLKFMLHNEATDYLELDFGEQRALIDWFK
jgi:Fe-S-cluster containining protein